MLECDTVPFSQLHTKAMYRVVEIQYDLVRTEHLRPWYAPLLSLHPPATFAPTNLEDKVLILSDASILMILKIDKVLG